MYKSDKIDPSGYPASRTQKGERERARVEQKRERKTVNTESRKGEKGGGGGVCERNTKWQRVTRCVYVYHISMSCHA